MTKKGSITMHVLLANQSKAVLFNLEKNKKKGEIKKIFENKKIKMRESEIFSHKAGTSQTSHTNNSTTLGENHFKEELISKFSNEINQYLFELSNRGEMDSLIIVSGPSFLGELRNKEPQIVKNVIKKELNKNFYTESEHELREFLDKSLSN